ncbi:MAG: serine/threonine protein kinase [Verrucomicrobiales bacterium]|nr:serine/threonine protein kinase [Verrucomicrobiales bacterium]
MNARLTCPKCGNLLPADAPRGICPDCLLGLLATDPTTDELFRARTQNTETTERRDAGKRFGDYELLEEIDRGGMGVVYKARQLSLNRIVAVKLILAGQFAGKQVAQRFRGEAAAAAVLQHPNIVAVHDIGVQDGQHFFSMDYVQGQNLAQLVGNRPLAPAKAAHYVKLIAEAIHYAHGQGILHRDLKPSNVLIDAVTDQPRMTDFGIAKRLANSELGTQNSELTLTGHVLGSPNFMPPEQAGGGRGKVGRQSDVYALGGILYHLLTARAPFQADSLEAIVTQVLHSQPVAPLLLNPSVPLDLETVCLKCLEKEPSRRYPTAEALADELGRFLRGEPTLARPLGPLAQLGRWIRRKPALAALAGASILGLAAFAISLVWADYRVNQREEIVRRNAYVADMRLAGQAIEAKNLGHATQLLETWRPAAQRDIPDEESESDLRGFEWFYFNRQCRSDELFTLGSLSNAVLSIATSPDGRFIAAGSETGEVKLWDISRRDESSSLLARDHESQSNSQLTNTVRLVGAIHHEQRVDALAFSADGRLLATGSMDKSARLWEVASLREAGPILWHRARVIALAFTSDNTRLHSVSLNEWKVWAVPEGREIAVQSLSAWQRAAIAPDLRTVAIGQPDGNVTLWEPISPQTSFQLRGHTAYVLPVTFSLHGARVASASFDGVARVWDVATRREVAALRGHQGGIGACAFSPDSQIVATAGYDQTLKLWDATTGGELASLQGHHSALWAVSFAPHGWLITGDKGGILKVWRSQPKPRERDSFELPGSGGIVLAPDDKAVSYASRSGVPARVELWGGGLLQDKPHLITAEEGVPVRADFSSANDAAAVIVSGNAVRLYALDDGREVGRFTISGVSKDLITKVAFSPRRRLAACVCWDGVWIREIQIDREVAFIPPSRIGWDNATFSSDGGLLAIMRGSGPIVLWDVNLRQELGILHGHRLLVTSVVFSRDGRRLASSGEDGTVRLWDLDTLREIAVLRSGADAFWSAAFSPDEHRIAAGTGDGRVVLFDLRTHQEVATLTGHHQPFVGPLAFSHDGKTLVSATEAEVRVWRTAP